METNELKAEAVHVFISHKENAIYVRDEFADEAAMAFHLQHTAGPHFPELLKIATPGPFMFFGNVGDELKAATEQMNLGGEFAGWMGGFQRSLKAPNYDKHITVVYKWTAKEGKLSALQDIYRGVTKQMKGSERKAQAVHVFTSEGAIYVRDEFKDPGALAFHLRKTAGPHFPELLEIATPGPFMFFGDVPQDLKAATDQMNLNAEFASHMVGFDRASEQTGGGPCVIS